MKVTLAHQYNTGRKRCHDCADDFRARLLKRLGEDSDTELERRSAREGDLETVIREVNIVRRVALPDREDDVYRLRENLVAVEIEDADCLRIGRQRASADSHYEAALRQMVEHRGVHRNHHR